MPKTTPLLILPRPPAPRPGLDVAAHAPEAPLARPPWVLVAERVTFYLNLALSCMNDGALVPLEWLTQLDAWTERLAAIVRRDTEGQTRIEVMRALTHLMQTLEGQACILGLRRVGALLGLAQAAGIDVLQHIAPQASMLKGAERGAPTTLTLASPVTCPPTVTPARLMSHSPTPMWPQVMGPFEGARKTRWIPEHYAPAHAPAF